MRLFYLLITEYKCEIAVIVLSNSLSTVPFDSSKQVISIIFQAKIHRVLVDIFKVASAEQLPRGLGKCKRSRAMYAVDLLLEWQRDTSSGEARQSCYQIQPQVCEVNFSPDCNRACEFHPNFYNDIFDCLFLDKVDCSQFIKLV